MAGPTGQGRRHRRGDGRRLPGVQARLPLADEPHLHARSRRTSTSSRSWLVDQRTAEDTGIVFTIFNWFRDLSRQPRRLAERLLPLDDVAWYDRCRDARRVALRRADALRRSCSDHSRRIALLGLWEASMETLALMIASVGARAAHRRSDRHRRGPIGSVPEGDQPVPRRDADRAGVRVPDAGRAALLDRLRRGGRLDHRLRDSARRSDHGARDSRRRDEHRRGLGVDGRDAPSDALEGAAARSRAGCCCSASTRRSSSRSRWS